MDVGLAGKSVVVTGASRGIGLAIVRALAGEGARVVAAARGSSPELAELVASGKVRSVAADLIDPAAPAAIVAEAVSASGGLDVLVNNVGAVHPRLGGFVEIDDRAWADSLELNFLAAVRMTRVAIPQLVRRGGGSVVTVSSVNAFLPDPGIMDYCAAKAALTNFCKALSKEVGRHGIRVNSVSPGPVRTDLWLGASGVAATVAGAQRTEPEAVVKQVAESTASGRFSTPEEVADLVVFLAGARAGNVTGSDFVIDGGLVTTVR